MGKSLLFLKNEFGICLKFNRTRGRDDEEETSEDEKNYCQQREKLHRCRINFEQALEERHSLRRQDVVSEHFDMLSIDFLKIADSTLTSHFCQVYGLSELIYSNMIQTVLFAMFDEDRFKIFFLTQIDSFSRKENNYIK